MTFIGIIMIVIGLVSFFVNSEPDEKWDTLILAFIGLILVLITL